MVFFHPLMTSQASDSTTPVEDSALLVRVYLAAFQLDPHANLGADS
jgi:hypothetical protein